MRTPSRITFAIWVTLVTFAICMLGIREELRQVQTSNDGYRMANHHGTH